MVCRHQASGIGHQGIKGSQSLNCPDDHCLASVAQEEGQASRPLIPDICPLADISSLLISRQMFGLPIPDICQLANISPVLISRVIDSLCPLNFEPTLFLLILNIPRFMFLKFLIPVPVYLCFNQQRYLASVRQNPDSHHRGEQVFIQFPRCHTLCSVLLLISGWVVG